tara:strand:+ start:3716 stop:3925 length:210 start_codon:yes stop_codon:yes gene_type:complete
MQKFMTMQEVKNAIDPKIKDLFTEKDLVMIEVSMKFLLEKFYNEDKDIGTDTHTRLVSIKEKCRDALEK